jgi:hypothetical protein
VKRSKRILILGICVEVVLGALLLLLLNQFGANSAETTRRIGTALGGAMGALGGFFAIWWFFLRRSGD